MVQPGFSGGRGIYHMIIVADTRKRKRGRGRKTMADWSVQETRCLLGIWGDADVQCKLDGVVRNKIIYELIARELEMLGYERTWQQ